jgi:hypothetical protein
MEVNLIIIGVILIVLAIVHVIFPQYFNWEKELANLSLINKEMMYVHTFFVALTVFLIGLLCLTSYNDLIHTILGKRMSLGLSIFWFIRLLIQFGGYSSSLWKGKRFETFVHIVFSILWTYLTLIFFLIFWGK